MRELTSSFAAIIDLILRLNDERNTSTLLVTHDLGTSRACNGVLLLVDGRVVDAAVPRR